MGGNQCEHTDRVYDAGSRFLRVHESVNMIQIWFLSLGPLALFTDSSSLRSLLSLLHHPQPHISLSFFPLPPRDSGPVQGAKRKFVRATVQPECL